MRDTLSVPNSSDAPQAYQILDENVLFRWSLLVETIPSVLPWLTFYQDLSCRPHPSSARSRLYSWPSLRWNPLLLTCTLFSVERVISYSVVSRGDFMRWVKFAIDWEENSSSSKSILEPEVSLVSLLNYIVFHCSKQSCTLWFWGDNTLCATTTPGDREGADNAYSHSRYDLSLRSISIILELSSVK